MKKFVFPAEEFDILMNEFNSGGFDCVEPLTVEDVEYICSHVKLIPNFDNRFVEYHLEMDDLLYGRFIDFCKWALHYVNTYYKGVYCCAIAFFKHVLGSDYVESFLKEEDLVNYKGAEYRR